MGMFDEMTIECRCGGTLIRQFKELRCNLDRYNLSILELNSHRAFGDKVFEDMSTEELCVLLAVKYADQSGWSAPTEFYCSQCDTEFTPEPPEELRVTALRWLQE
jgi:hypothetical protein